MAEHSKAVVAEQAKGTLSLSRLQAENKKWADHNFAGRLPYQPLLGIVEEVGELAHAHLKSEQGIRGSKAKHREKAADAIGDIIIFMADYCNQNGFDLQDCLTSTWAKVKQRDWINNPQNGQLTAAGG